LLEASRRNLSRFMEQKILVVDDDPKIQRLLEFELEEMGVKTYLPLKDVTPPQYIDAIITEKGVTSPQGVPIMLWEIYGHWPYVEPDIHTLLEEMRKIVSSHKA